MSAAAVPSLALPAQAPGDPVGSSPAALSRRRGRGAAAARTGPAFFVFILINATLFMRPAEIVPALLGLPIYQLLNIACIAMCLPLILQKLSRRYLRQDPISACVVALLPAVVLSRLSHLELGGAASALNDFTKPLFYYLMLLALVDSPRRLRSFLFWMAFLTSALTALALLHYPGVVDIPAMRAAREQWHGGGDEGGAGGPVELLRMCAAGIFGNPNDFARILVVGIFIAAYFSVTSRSPGRRIAWLAPLAMMGYALHLTHSRGGLLALMSGLVLLLRGYFKGWRFYAAGAAVAPVLLMAYRGRDLAITTASGTGQQRIRLWSEGLSLFHQSPVFGIGMRQYAQQVGLVAHNSFVHCFVELGLAGGTLFAGAFYLAFWQPYRLDPSARPEAAAAAATADPELLRLRPFVAAMLGGTIVGMLSSTRSYEIPTYAFLGIAATWVQLATAGNPAARLVLDGRLARRLSVVGLATLLGLYLYVRLAVHWE